MTGSFVEPSIIKAYLAAGVTVPLTAAQPIGRLIESRGAGRVVEYSMNALATAFTDDLGRRRLLESARASATALGGIA
jgi:hypothetical protein